MQTDCQFQLLIPEEHPCYSDHFPNDALVPGALLMKWIVRRLESMSQCTIHELKSIKFMGAVRPGQELMVSVQTSATKNATYNLECCIENTIVIKGQLGYQHVLEQH